MTPKPRVTDRRERARLTIAALARKADMSASTVGQIESGRLVPYPVQLEKIAAALGYEGDPSELLDEVSGDE
ncbi:MAG: helix-turn-helix transcriptional regulator [Coriobacteriia bacterium]